MWGVYRPVENLFGGALHEEPRESFDCILINLG